MVISYFPIGTRNVDINNLRAFSAVSELESFSAAAQRLHVTQPAISKRIGQLEAQLRSPLFLRTGHGVRLTQAGVTLLPHAGRILGEVEAANRAMNSLSGVVSGPLTIVTNHHIGVWRLPDLLRDFTGDYPEVRLDLRFTDSEPAHQLVLDGTVEVGIVTLAPHPAARLTSVPLWDDALQVVVSVGHELASADSAQLSDLAAYRAILPGLSTYTGRLVRSRMGELGLTLQDVMTTNYLETLRMMAATGLGWSLLPASMIGPDLHVLAVPELAVVRTLGLIHHRQHVLSAAALAFIQATRSKTTSNAANAGADSDRVR